MTRLVAASVVLLALSCSAQGQQADKNTAKPWMDTKLSPDQRADLVIRTLTLDEKIQLLHGTGEPHVGPVDPLARDDNGGSGYVPGFPDKGIPGLQIIDSAAGVCYSAASGRYSTALPSDLAAASSWDPQVAESYGRVIGQELRDLGYNMSLAGGVNLTREPRDGRTFEYQGEDPLLAGTMVGHVIRGIQSTHTLGHIKHFAVNDQESGRHAVSSEISERAMRETDLLAFKIGIDVGQPGAVMCAYNRVNGDYACENDFLLRTVLKDDWHYKGFVISDWLATHSTVKASHAGLDNEEPGNTFYDAAFKKAVGDGSISQAELNDHVHRILRSMFATGIVDDPATKRVPDVFGDANEARDIEHKSIVLLRDEHATLPLDPAKAQRILVVGRAADRGVISGGGSAQVDPPNGNAIGDIPEKDRKQDWQKAVWFPDSPLNSIRQSAPNATVDFDDGSDINRAALAAKSADVVLLYAYQWQAEGVDLPTLALPDGQDALITAVSKANPKTVVVLETGGPVLMPWIDATAAVVETWFSGTAGAPAIADVLFGKINPSGKLAVTFPLRDADLPHPQLVLPPPASQEDWSDEKAMSKKLLVGLPSFPTRYDEGLEVGYRWYDAQHKAVLFPFGFGLSYTQYEYRDMKITARPDALQVQFKLKNSGSRDGEEVAEVYTEMPASSHEPPKRLIGWSKVPLIAGEEKLVTIEIPKDRLSIWDERLKQWTTVPAEYTLSAGGSSQSLPLKQAITIK